MRAGLKAGWEVGCQRVYACQPVFFSFFFFFSTVAATFGLPVRMQVGLAELLSVTLGSSAESRTELLQVLFQKLRHEQIPNAFPGLDTSALHGEGATTFESFRRFMEQGPALQEALRRKPHCFDQHEEDGSESVGHLSSEGAALDEWNT